MSFVVSLNSKGRESLFFCFISLFPLTLKERYQTQWFLTFSPSHQYAFSVFFPHSHYEFFSCFVTHVMRSMFFSCVTCIVLLCFSFNTSIPFCTSLCSSFLSHFFFVMHYFCCASCFLLCQFFEITLVEFETEILNYFNSNWCSIMYMSFIEFLMPLFIIHRLLRVYESSLSILHKSTQTRESDNLAYSQTLSLTLNLRRCTLSCFSSMVKYTLD